MVTTDNPTVKLALYFQDNFKVTPRLTLQLGLRWEYWSPYHDKRVVGFDRKSNSVVLGTALVSAWRNVPVVNQPVRIPGKEIHYL